MDIKAIKQLAEKYDIPTLEKCIEQLELSGKCDCCEKPDPADTMSDLLQAIEVRALTEKGHSLQEAVRELSRRVRGVLTK